MSIAADTTSDRLLVEQTVQQAAESLTALKSMGTEKRAQLLELLAQILRRDAGVLAALAATETHLPNKVLEGEIERTATQSAFMASVIREGSHLQLSKDDPQADSGHSLGHTSYRAMFPLGVVAIFGASNFVFAYGVAGGDTVSALAAGNPVVVKEHPAHPETCRAVLAIIHEALIVMGLPTTTVGMVSGFEAGRDLVQHDLVRAVGFTGSVSGGRALYNLCVSRSSPIPFYGELGSVNPVVISHGASKRPREIVEALSGSWSVRAAQVCTKPGVIFVPREADSLLQTLSDSMPRSPQPLLNSAIADSYRREMVRRLATNDVVVLAGSTSDGNDNSVIPTFVEVSAARFVSQDGAIFRTECFGPHVIAVRYDDEAHLERILGFMDPALVGAVFTDMTEGDFLTRAVSVLTRQVGRVVANATTAGLPIGWSTQHGGRYPASTFESSTSVGASAIDRWLRPISFQNFNDQNLPEIFSQAQAGMYPFRHNGVLKPQSLGI